MTLSCHASYAPLGCDSFSDCHLFLMTLTVLRSTHKILYRLSLNWDVSDVFLKIRLGLWVYGRKTAERNCHSHHGLSRARAVRMPCHCWCWPGSLGSAVLVRVLHCIVILPPTPSHFVLFGRKPLSTAHTYKVGSCTHFPEGRACFYFYN